MTIISIQRTNVQLLQENFHKKNFNYTYYLRKIFRLWMGRYQLQHGSIRSLHHVNCSINEEWIQIICNKRGTQFYIWRHIYVSQIVCRRLVINTNYMHVPTSKDLVKLLLSSTDMTTYSPKSKSPLAAMALYCIDSIYILFNCTSRVNILTFLPDQVNKRDVFSNKYVNWKLYSKFSILN